MTLDVAGHRDCTPLPGRVARVVVVDDHPMIRSGLSAVLSGEPDLEVCGLACDGDEGAEIVLRERPDVVLMDVAMPGVDGIEATRSIVTAWPQAKVVMLTALGDLGHVRAALAAGAFGYVLKDADARSVVCAVRQALRGCNPITAEIAALLVVE